MKSINHLHRWWFYILFIFTPILAKMIQFDSRIFFRWVVQPPPSKSCSPVSKLHGPVQAPGIHRLFDGFSGMWFQVWPTNGGMTLSILGLFPFLNGRTLWLINVGGPNHLRPSWEPILQAAATENGNRKKTKNPGKIRGDQRCGSGQYLTSHHLWGRLVSRWNRCFLLRIGFGWSVTDLLVIELRIFGMKTTMIFCLWRWFSSKTSISEPGIFIVDD